MQQQNRAELPDFHTKNHSLVQLWGDLELENASTINGHLVYLLYGHLVYFMPFWYILGSFGTYYTPFWQRKNVATLEPGTRISLSEFLCKKKPATVATYNWLYIQ
jgi:hypothetical protein